MLNLHIQVRSLQQFFSSVKWKLGSLRFLGYNIPGMAHGRQARPHMAFLLDASKIYGEECLKTYLQLR